MLLSSQTPEKKANDQRVRKRKADHFDSQGRIVSLSSFYHVSHISSAPSELPDSLFQAKQEQEDIKLVIILR